ncbi:MAG: hypothetical protein NTV09_09600 [Bacteroidetes bacterium]|nr:hypothetical protein [Bacteroidota bacterium]
MKKPSDLLFSFVILLLYLCLVIFAMHNHELWGDEIHSWNIVKGSHSFQELFQNIRYEGHPPFWYCYLYCFTLFSHSLFYLKAAQLVFVAAAALVLLFFSPFSKLQKILLLGGYYFIFEYAVLARNYMPTVFFAFCIATIFDRDFRFKMVIYYFLLFALSNVHLLGLLLAVSIHTGFCFEKFTEKRSFVLHLLIGLVVFLPAVYFILPPSDSQLNFEFWKSQWTVSRFYLIVTVIVKSFIPLQEWFNQHWWNTSFILDDDSVLFRIIGVGIFVCLLSMIYYGARKSKTALVILGVNLFLTFILSLVFPLNTARYVGFVFIGFVVTAWLSFSDSGYSFNRNVIILIAILQIPPGIIALSRDSKEQFSSARSVLNMNKEIPKGAFVATDYWCLNNLSAYIDTSFYCIEMKRRISFLTWNSEMKAVIHFNYADALDTLLSGNQNQAFYFYSVQPVGQLLADGQSKDNMRLLLMGDSGISIEKSGRVYLYRVERL